MTDTANKQKAKKESFFKGVKREFNKITWPDTKTAAKQTLAVVVVAAILGVIITFLDHGVQMGIDWLTSIQL